ncbi:MAG: AAA family ATPase [Candidatus Omnitrophica bacterium]|nr:AAA family ATPase [Candidatus Omnitrophota bacterium]
MINWRIVKMHFINHWVKILIISIAILLVAVTIYALSTLESFHRQIMIVQMPVSILIAGIHATIFIFMYLTFLRGGFAKLDKAPIKGKGVNIHWDDVIGIDEAKLEAWEVVQLIKDRHQLHKIGGKIIRGLLFIGPAGCGKTYLAKAVATEAGIPFISMSGSEFVEVFVGVGAARVRKLFARARNLAYGHGGCIVFLDELDAIGRSRTFSFMGGQETNSTQNQLLVELDGLKDKSHNVIVIGATNAAESTLDSALLRPGRFDRKIYIDRPSLEGREKVFSYYLKTVKSDPNIDVGRLARKCVYKTPADIQNIVKEAALIAMRYGKDTVTHKEISEAIERVDMGIKHKRTMSGGERRMVASHESGHLIVMYRLHPTDDVFKASIVSRRETLGIVYSQPREEYFTSSRNRILANIKVSLGGYVAEKLCFGVTSDGVATDFKQAMNHAHNMVWKYGMGPEGLLGDYTSIPPSQISETTKDKLNSETNKIFQLCYAEVEELLNKESILLNRFVDELLKKEELEYDEIETIFREYDKEDVKNFKA